MAKILPFRRRRRWRNESDYGRVLPTHVWKGQRPIRRWLFAARPFVLFIVLAAVWNGIDPALMEAPSFLSTKPELVVGTFTRCGPGRGTNCVIDGDTFKLGERKVRIVGIDAPETHPARCPDEAQSGEAATQRLLALLNKGPFEMTGRLDDQRDAYGRELRALYRMEADGSRSSIAKEMLASGTVRRYLGGLRGGWC